MPELPEVETLVRRLREPVIGRTIEEVTIYWKRTIARPAPKEFARMLHGYTVRSIDRRALESRRQPDSNHAARHRLRPAARRRITADTSKPRLPANRLLSSY
jgi:hypothetical protein